MLIGWPGKAILSSHASFCERKTEIQMGQEARQSCVHSDDKFCDDPGHVRSFIVSGTRRLAGDRVIAD